MTLGSVSSAQSSRGNGWDDAADEPAKGKAKSAGKVADASPSRQESEATNAAAAGAVAGQQAGRARSAEVLQAKADKGYDAAKGPTGVGVDDIRGSAARAITNAPPAQRANVENVVQRLGVAISDGKLVGTPDGSQQLREALDKAARSPNTGSDYRGAMAQLTAAAERLDQVRLAPNTKMAFDPQNVGGRGEGVAEADAGLPKLDQAKVDADLNYREDNRSFLDRGLDQMVRDKLRGGPDLSQQPLTIESVKSTADAFSKDVNSSIKNPGPSTQVGRQIAWENQGTPEQPRQFKATMVVVKASPN
jgi:hypothetical protein